MTKLNKRNSKATETVWHFLLDNAGEQFYLTQIAQQTKVSDSTVQQVLEKKVKQGLVKKKKLGNLSFYSLVENSLVKQEKILRTIQIIESLVNQLKEWSQKIILYGSAATGENTVKSDIDLFILSNKKDKIWKIFSRSKIKNKVKLVVKNFLEWVQTKEKDKFFFSAVNRGKILWEGYETV